MSKRKKIVALLAGAFTGVAALAAGLRRKRATPEEQERRRRALVSASGKMASGTATDLEDGVISYTYTVAGVEYFATQNLSSLAGLLPPNPEILIGRPLTVKYLPANPANSIVLAEDWSGLLFSPQAEQTAGRTN